MCGLYLKIALLCALHGEKCQASFDPISNRVQIFRGFIRFEWTKCTRNAWDTDEFSSCESLYVVVDCGQHVPRELRTSLVLASECWILLKTYWIQHEVGKPWYCIKQTTDQVYSFMSVCIVTPNDYSVATRGRVSRVPQCYLPDQMTILTPHPITWAALTLEFLWKGTNVLGSVLRRRCSWDTSEDWWLLACKTWEWIWDF